MDFNGDGKLDLLSGSWPGELYLFLGEGKGRFAAATILKDKGGKAINPGSASTVFATDFNGDGTLDLLMGNIEGDVKVALNEGSRARPVFGRRQFVQVGNRNLRLSGGDSHAILADWDNDGTPDLLIGAGDGKVVWYRNAGTTAAPQWESHRALLAPQAPSVLSYAKTKDVLPGWRAKICVADWNGDGKNDLLVGDYGSKMGEPPKLTPAQQREKRELERQLEATEKELRALFRAMEKMATPPNDPKKISAWQAEQQALTKKYRKPLERHTQIFVRLQKYEAPQYTLGYVWAMLAQSNAISRQ